MATLESLPPEIIFSIYFYLSPLPPADEPPSTHPFFALSCTSKHLRSHLESYLTHAIVTSNASSLAMLKEILTTPPTQPTKKLKSGSSKRPLTTNLLLSYLKCISSTCFSCGCNSTRRAIMEPSLVCCAGCDHKCWPTKVTMSTAQTKYRLKKEDLFGGALPPEFGGPPPPPPRKDGIIPKKPGLKYGQFTHNNVLTTMFLEEDVRMLAWEKHAVADIDVYVAQRKEKVEEHKRKMEANKTKRKAYVDRLAVRNGLNAIGMITGWEASRKNRGIEAILSLIRLELLLKKLGVRPANAAQPSWVGTGSAVSPFWHAITSLMVRNNFISMSQVWGSVNYGTRYLRTQILYRRVMSDGSVENMFLGDIEGSERVGPRFGRSTSSSPPPAITDVSRIPLRNFAARPMAPTQQYMSTADLSAMMYRRTVTVVPRLRVPREFVRDEVFALKLMEWVDPVDYFLFLEFIQEFGEGEGNVGDELKQPRDLINERYKTLRELYVEEIGAGSENERVAAPWSWKRYPVLVQEVAEEKEECGAIAFGQSGSGTAEEVQRRNERRREEYERLCARIREVLRESGWEVLADPERWAREVEAVVVEEGNVVKSEKVKRKGKGKGKGKKIAV
ncbi:hypothetical protein BDZ91DRAFT_741214 [Kalaharituber pfeilii]|nr:hypothetical protein BDZ91DRAFT_741214 [Kalaharituber pfeilii]